MFGIDRERKRTSPGRIARRVKKASSEDLTLWADQVFISTHQAFRSWQTTGDSAMLAEAALGSEALHEVMSEIRRREKAPLM